MCLGKIFTQNLLKISEAYSEHSQISKMKNFVEIDNIFQLLIIFPKRSILDVWHVLNTRLTCSEYASAYNFIKK